MSTFYQASGWEMSHDLGPGGIVLRNVTHQGYGLADDIRLTRVWVGAPPPDDRTAPRTSPARVRSFVPGSAELPAQLPAFPLKPGAYPPGGFGIYPTVGGLAAEFEADTAIPNLRNDRMRLRQTFLFGPLSKDPPHEPGAVLRAARLFPLLTFTVTPGPEPLPGPSYFRADFRFGLDLSPGPALSRGADPSQRRDLAGVFRDHEDTPSPLQDTSTSVPRLAGLADVFAGAEKPLHHEFLGPGLRLRRSAKPAPRTWDNYHHFPKAEDGSLPSTPGAFHCLHLHWRWGAVSATSSRVPPLVGGDQFKGLGWTPQVGGPLIDPTIPGQDLTLAVTTDSGPGTPWAAELNPSEWQFADLFTNRRAEPLPVKDGAKLTLWVSIEVERPPGKENVAWGGTLFEHGMYFAHDFEPTVLRNRNPDVGLQPGAMAAVGGLRGPLVKESVSPDAKPMPWWRYPPP
ncbi:hypothetical protein Lfu02_75170 [Longispora fulva]|uniref:Uncharacterized protein n=1 Tax=Longispora fulva TaxID=619741 RepID=A0A8J7G5W4_9ACTN|nr:hypothetical protein [Longispora fulva]MBG6134253.1 hypothetical protein [Longispora fulva]GIG63145.1 hypothetical protein Lfu02_75170 [Longispora fulva]